MLIDYKVDESSSDLPTSVSIIYPGSLQPFSGFTSNADAASERPKIEWNKSSCQEEMLMLCRLCKTGVFLQIMALGSGPHTPSTPILLPLLFALLMECFWGRREMVVGVEYSCTHAHTRTRTHTLALSLSHFSITRTASFHRVRERLDYEIFGQKANQEHWTS